MHQKFTLAFAATAVAAAITGCSPAAEPTASATPQFANCSEAGEHCTRFTILHTNDHHGHFWPNKLGEVGMAARKTLIDQIRAEVTAQGGQVLLLSGGDINTGVPESDLQNAKPDFLGMSHLGYDAMAVGNHEFDNPLSVLEQQRQWANFPMLSANIYHQPEGSDALERYFQPYQMFTIGSLKLAVVGLITDETATIANPEFVKDLVFTRPADEMNKIFTELQAEQPDMVIALTHMGHYQNGQHGSNAPGDVTLARSLPAGLLDAIIGGHSQNPVCMEARGSNRYAKYQPLDECIPDQQNGTWIMQAHEWGKYVGQADFEYFNGELQLANYKLVPVNLKRKDANGDYQFIGPELAADESTVALLAPYQEIGQAKLGEVIGQSVGTFNGERSVARSQITDLGKLIAQSHSKGPVQADFAIMNSGGIRASLAAGDVSYRDVLTIQPFANSVTRTVMSGAELLDYLPVVATIEQGSGGYAHFDGIEMTVNCADKTVAVARINGQPFDLNQHYSFTLPSYNAAGGNSYPVLDNAVNSGFVDADLLYQFIKQRGQLNPADFAPQGEVVYAQSDSPLGCSVK